MIAIGSDHAGFEDKEKLKLLLQELGEPYQDFGTTSTESCDYPDFAHAVATAVSEGTIPRGILICGTGIGMSIVANKHTHVRAAVCESLDAVRLSRQHNDANILCLGARLTPWEAMADMVRLFLTTPFDTSGRHSRRIEKIHTLTNL